MVNGASASVGAPPTARADVFTQFAAWTCRITGGRAGFLTAFVVVIVWALLGPVFRFSSDWQLVINTGTTIVTFLMVFLIQNAQNRESKALHLKLNELIYAVNRARNELIDIEHLTEEELDELGKRYARVAALDRRDRQKLNSCPGGEDGVGNGPMPAHITVK